MMATSDEENCVVDITCMQQVKVPLMDSNIVVITSRDIIHWWYIASSPSSKYPCSIVVYSANEEVVNSP